MNSSSLSLSLSLFLSLFFFDGKSISWRRRRSVVSERRMDVTGGGMLVLSKQ